MNYYFVIIDSLRENILNILYSTFIVPERDSGALSLFEGSLLHHLPSLVHLFHAARLTLVFHNLHSLHNQRTLVRVSDARER